MKNKLLRFILLPFVSLFIGVNIYYFNSTQIIGNKLPMPFGYGASVVLSGSMSPAFEVNDVIIVKETNDYEVGDIVVYQNKKEIFLIVHRIVEIRDDLIITQGDANNVADAGITADQIKGEVVHIIPKAGSLINAIKSPLGIILIIGLSFSLLEMSYKKEKREDASDIELLKEEIRKYKEKQE